MSQEAKLAQKESSNSSSEATPLNVQDLMLQIRAQVKEEIAKNGRGASAPQFKPKLADNNAGNFKAGALLHSEELAFLNSNYAYGILDLNKISSHRPGVLGQLVVKVKRKILAWFWDSLLKDYFSKEREFQANLVRLLNNFTRYTDERDAANFWEIIRKVDVDVTNALERIERLADEQVAALRYAEKNISQEFYSALTNLQQQVSQLQAQTEQNQASLKVQGTVVQGIEGIISRAAKIHQSGSDQVAYDLAVKADAADAAADATLAAGLSTKDYSYLLLENRFRGSEDEIAERQSFYADIFATKSLASKSASVLDIGCGRGELLQAFKNRDISAYGIDLDTAMVERCLSKDLQAKQADLLQHLDSLPASSLAGVVALQVVEHLNMKQLQTFFEQCCTKVQPGGLVVFETINPRSLLALSSNYFRDPTHVWPLHPDTLAYLMSLAGLEIKETKFLAPVPEGAQLKEIEFNEQLTPRYQELLQKINANLRQVNELLYGYQDYCVIAQVK